PIKFVSVPPGEFTMGCSEDNIPMRLELERLTPVGKILMECAGAEKPPHHVRITKGFEIGKYEVTQDEWASVMTGKPTGIKTPRHPIEEVSWVEAQKFCEKLNSRQDGFQY